MSFSMLLNEGGNGCATASRIQLLGTGLQHLGLDIPKRSFVNNGSSLRNIFSKGLLLTTRSNIPWP